MAVNESMLFGDLIKGFYAGWDVGSRTLFCLDYLWGAPKMKLGLEVAAVAMIATAQASCPDYTTYAQVNMPLPR